MGGLLLHAQEAQRLPAVVVVERLVLVELAPPLGAHLAAVVALHALATLDLATGGDLDPLRGRAVGLHLGHGRSSLRPGRGAAGRASRWDYAAESSSVETASTGSLTSSAAGVVSSSS